MSAPGVGASPRWRGDLVVLLAALGLLLGWRVLHALRHRRGKA